MKRQRVALTRIQKREICILLSQKPPLTQTAVARQYGIKQNTVSDIWNKREKWLATNDEEISSKRKRERRPQYPMAYTKWS